jgi:type 1 glutamine amidotransferase
MAIPVLAVASIFFCRRALWERFVADSVEKLLRRSLLEWVSNGGGIVAYHHAIGGNNHWPEFLELLGAGYWGHPWNEEVGVKLEEPDHPLLAAFRGKKFRIAEEIFEFREPYSRQKVRVLLSLDTSTTNMKVKWIYRKDNDFALAWVRQYGKGRAGAESAWCFCGGKPGIATGLDGLVSASAVNRRVCK